MLNFGSRKTAYKITTVAKSTEFMFITHSLFASINIQKAYIFTFKPPFYYCQQKYWSI